MKKLLSISAAFLLSSGILGTPFGGHRDVMAAEANVPTDTQSSPSSESTPTTQAYDENGNPMTPEEFAKAYKARMEAKSAETENRLKARQSKWKKDRNKKPQEPSASPQ